MSSTKRDGWMSRLEFWALTHFPRGWRFAQRHSAIEPLVNGFLINRAVARTPARPYRLTALADRPGSTRHAGGA